ncbi:MAG: hypothetical protein JXA57_16720 [Armatimonadetes bacterium]|nr:hypothetical protein [Armatimonadota bacterium]
MSGSGATQYWFDEISRCCRDWLRPERPAAVLLAGLRMALLGLRHLSRPAEQAEMLRLLCAALEDERSIHAVHAAFRADPLLESYLEEVITELEVQSEAPWGAEILTERTKLQAWRDAATWRTAATMGHRPDDTVLVSAVMPGHVRAVVGTGRRRRYEVVDLFARAIMRIPEPRAAQLERYWSSWSSMDELLGSVLARPGAVRLGGVLVPQFPNPIGSSTSPDQGRSLELAALFAALSNALGWKLVSPAPVLLGVIEPPLDMGEGVSASTIRVGAVEELLPKLKALLKQIEMVPSLPAPRIIVPRANLASPPPEVRRAVAALEANGAEVLPVGSLGEAVEATPMAADVEPHPHSRRPGLRSAISLGALVWFVVAERLLLGEYFADPVLRDGHTDGLYVIMVIATALLPGIAAIVGTYLAGKAARPLRWLGFSLALLLAGLAAAFSLWHALDLLPPWQVTPTYAGTGGAGSRPFDVGKDLLAWYFGISAVLVYPVAQYVNQLRHQRRRLGRGQLEGVGLALGYSATRAGYLARIGRYYPWLTIFAAIALPLVLVFRLGGDLYQVIGNGAGAPLIGHIVFQMLAPAFLGGGLALWIARAQHQHRLDYQQK